MPKPNMSGTPVCVKQQAAAQTDVDRWHYERDSRQAAVMAAEAQVILAKLNLSYTQVTAPFTGAWAAISRTRANWWAPA